MALSLTKMDDVIVCFSFDFWCRIVKGKILVKVFRGTANCNFKIVPVDENLNWSKYI